MDTGEKSIFVTATKVCSWSRPREMHCASCASVFWPDMVAEDGMDICHWIGMTWSDPRGCVPMPSDFCWRCAGLFLSGGYRGASHDYEVDLQEFNAAVQRVARRARRDALNPQESNYPALAIELIDHRLEGVHKLENSNVVGRRTFDSECRVGWPYT